MGIHATVGTERVLGYRCHQALALIRRHVEAEGVAPSYAMIRDELGLTSKAKVCELVKRLEKRGLICRSGEGIERRIRLVEAVRAEADVAMALRAVVR